jgi:hypothetical protein
VSNSQVLELIDAPLYAFNDVPRAEIGRLLHLAIFVAFPRRLSGPSCSRRGTTNLSDGRFCSPFHSRPPGA